MYILWPLTYCQRRRCLFEIHSTCSVSWDPHSLQKAGNGLEKMGLNWIITCEIPSWVIGICVACKAIFPVVNLPFLCTYILRNMNKHEILKAAELQLMLKRVQCTLKSSSHCLSCNLYSCKGFHCLLSFFFFLIYLFALLFCPCKGVGSPGTVIIDSWELPCGCWELNPHPLEE